MPLFRRRDRPEPPHWALGLTADTYGPFIATVREELKRRGLTDAVIDEEDGVVRRGEVGLGLHNLAQQYAQAGRRERAGVVRTHFEQVVSASEERDAVARSFEQAAAALKVRLYQDGYGGAVHRPLAEGIVESLVLDLPSTVASVSDDDVAAWGRELSDLFLRAYENLDDDPPPALERLALGENDELLAYSAEDFFVTSRLLFVEHLVSDIPEHGLVVAVPNRHVLLVYRIRDLRVVQAIQRLIPMVQGLYERGPGSLATDLYWWQAGELIRLPVETAGTQLSFAPPDSFVELLNTLT